MAGTNTSRTTSPEADHPGVWFPPPLIYALTIVSGLLLDRRWPWPIGGGLARFAMGVILVAAFLALLLTALGTFRRHRTAMLPFRPASHLVAGGLYRWTRNPMYLGAALGTLGAALLLNIWWPFLLLVPALAILQQYVIRREEDYMRRRFGAEYEAYARQVRRWL